MKDWKSIAAGMRPEIPEADLERIVPMMEALEAAFRPLVTGIPREVEPAIALSEPAVLGK